MPRFQKLYEQYKDRADVQFLSLNMDENPGLIGPFVSEHKFTFTVIPAYSYVTDTLKIDAIPQNWIVDARGVVRLKAIGFDSGEKWELGMADALEKNKPEGSSATGAPTAKLAEPQNRKLQ